MWYQGQKTNDLTKHASEKMHDETENTRQTNAQSHDMSLDENKEKAHCKEMAQGKDSMRDRVVDIDQR